jgi:ribosomal protein S18 acetylase RimI-like enzyme
MNIVYKKASIDDAYDVAYIAAYSWKETYKGLLPDDYLEERVNNINQRLEGTKDFISKYDGNYIIVRDDDKPVGILAYRKSNNDKYNDYGYLEAIYVLKEYQEYNIGKELFKIAIEDFISMGYDKMYLECMKGNNALSFYEKYDGRIVDTINYHIRDDINPETYVMTFEDLENILGKLKDKTKQLL